MSSSTQPQQMDTPNQPAGHVFCAEADGTAGDDVFQDTANCPTRKHQHLGNLCQGLHPAKLEQAPADQGRVCWATLRIAVTYQASWPAQISAGITGGCSHQTTPCQSTYATTYRSSLEPTSLRAPVYTDSTIHSMPTCQPISFHLGVLRAPQGTPGNARAHSSRS